MSEEKKVIELDLDLCIMCHRVGCEISALNDEEDLMWFCVGEIIKPENPKDLHEKLNEIRVCLVKDSQKDDVSDVISFEWTPYEASRVAMGLTWAVSNYLIDEQPTLEDLDELKSSSLSQTPLRSEKQ